jgi:hypothetical protein
MSDALETVTSLANDSEFFGSDEWPYHKYPFGLWFRGHSSEGVELEPLVFRNKLAPPRDEKIGMWDETNVYEHLKLRVPSHEHTYHSAFDWLCLMQHYSVPTRLLDWSESILPALYFAVRDNATVDGELIVLNAKRLNGKSKSRPTISTPDDGHVIVRAEMAATRSAKVLARKKSVLTALEEEGIEASADTRWMEKFQRPIAVFPRRLNDRMIHQSSVFTLHGGKMYVPEMQKKYWDEQLPPPKTLKEVNREFSDREPLLRKYVIPGGRCKQEILDDLFRLGVHEASLFPEVDRQAVYLQQLWWY